MINQDPKSARIAIVDDEPVNVKVVRKHLQVAGYTDFVTTTDSTTSMAMLREQNPDVLLLDVMMPVVDGIQVLTEVRADPKLQHLPVLILTASTDANTKMRALNAGATDFLAKPVDPNDLVPRLKNALIVKAHQDHLSAYAEELERQVRLRTAELEASTLQVIYCLARAGEFRDEKTGHHVLRVGRYAAILARELGLPAEASRLIGIAAQLHDIGKIGVPDAILNKPGKLTNEEFAEIKKHCSMGGSIVRPLSYDELHAVKNGVVDSTLPVTEQPLLHLVRSIAMTHHERWDGKGYPNGLAGEAIPIEGRITSVADVFDALTSARAYKPAMTVEQTLKTMQEGRGTQFDPAVVDAMIRRIDEFEEVRRTSSDHDEHAAPLSIPTKPSTAAA